MRRNARTPQDSNVDFIFSQDTAMTPRTIRIVYIHAERI